MAYVGKDKKAKIKEALKKAIPKNWKWSLAVRHHSTAVLTIYSAPVDLTAEWTKSANKSRAAKGWEPLPKQDHVGVNEYHLADQFEGKTLKVFEAIREAMNTDNYDNSDSMTDYFDVGHYITINIGRWDKPFVWTPPGGQNMVRAYKGARGIEAAREEEGLPKDSMDRGFPHKKKPLF